MKLTEAGERRWALASRIMTNLVCDNVLEDSSDFDMSLAQTRLNRMKKYADIACEAAEQLERSFESDTGEEKRTYRTTERTNYA